MATTVSADVTIDDIQFAHRWQLRMLEEHGRMQQEHPQLFAAVLQCYFEAHAAPMTAAIAACLGCPAEHAEVWRWWLTIHLVSPGLYHPVFQQEDLHAARRDEWQAHRDDVRATQAHLTESQQRYELKLAESRIEAYAAEATQELARLDTENAKLQRHQARLPGAGTLHEAALQTAQADLAAAEAALKICQTEGRLAAEATLVREARARLQPVLALFPLMRFVDEAWARAGVPPSADTGTGLLRAVLS